VLARQWPKDYFDAKRCFWSDFYITCGSRMRDDSERIPSTILVRILQTRS
jgi:hypothetical protein